MPASKIDAFFKALSSDAHYELLRTTPVWAIQSIIEELVDLDIKPENITSDFVKSYVVARVS